MRSDYSFYMPTKLEIGKGKTKLISELLIPYLENKLMIVTDIGVEQAGLLIDIKNSLKESNIEFEVFNEVEPNPNAELIKTGLEFLEKTEADTLLAIGGGSSIDTAKAIAAMATNSGNILDYEGLNKLKEPPLPVIAVPTTAGTGSEVTASTVVTNNETFFKAVIVSPYLYPELAILDPLLTLSCPPSITAATGMDALTHAIESYVSKEANTISQALALQAIRMIKDNLPKSYFVGTDISSRSNMMEASMIAGFAFSQSRLGNVHAISHSFGGIFNIPHGIANAVILPYVLKFNLPACPGKMKDIAIALGEDVVNLSEDEASQKALSKVIELNKLLDIPSNVKELGVNLDKLSKIVEDSMSSANIKVNPRLTESKDIEQIITNAYYERLPTN